MTEKHKLGHRNRVREKFVNFGSGFFQDYELIELLLFYSIPVKDTKTIAKELLSKFGSVMNILTAEAEELCASFGIGKATAGLINLVADMRRLTSPPFDFLADKTFDYEDCGNRLVNFYKDKTENSVSLLTYNNSMNVISVEEVIKLNFSSGAVQPKKLIETAVNRRAAVAVIAYSRSAGPVFPFPSEMETVRLMEDAFRETGIYLAEQYLVSGDKFFGVMNNMREGLRLGRGIKPTVAVPLIATGREDNAFTEASEIALLSEILSFAKVKNPQSAANKLLEMCGGLACVSESFTSVIQDIIGSRNGAILIKVMAALCARSYTSELPKIKNPTDADIKRFIYGLFFGVSQEEIYILCFGKDGRFIAAEKLADGVVNGLDVMPRGIVDKVIKHKTVSVILAHNHPDGRCIPSPIDRDNNLKIEKILYSVGVPLISHYIIGIDGIESF